MNFGIAVFDASPMIIFHQVGQFDLLRGLFSQIIVPSDVAREVAPSLGRLPTWIEEQSKWPDQIMQGTLDVGEHAAISLGLAIGADFVVLDDLPARRVADRHGLAVIGSLGLLVRAKDSGLIEKVRSIMDDMVAWRLFVSPQLYQAILIAASEGEVHSDTNPEQ